MAELIDHDVHLAGIAARDADAFARWLVAAEPVLRRSLRRFAPAVDVESVVQETLLRAWQVAPRHRPDGAPNSLLRLALRIARNLAVDEARRSGRHVPYEDGADDDVLTARVADAAPDPLLARLLHRCLAALTGKPAPALHARLAAGGERDDELAAALGMAVNTFRQNVSRGRRAVVECLERAGVRAGDYAR